MISLVHSDFGYARVKAKNMTNEPGQRFYRAIEAFSLMEGEKPVYDEKGMRFNQTIMRGLKDE